jgi:hypothetical protein
MIAQEVMWATYSEKQQKPHLAPFSFFPSFSLPTANLSEIHGRFCENEGETRLAFLRN